MSASLLKVYVASLLGFSETTQSWYRSILLPALTGAGVEVLDPWDEEREPDPLPSLPTHHEYVSAWQALNRMIGSHNTQLIHQAHGVVAVLDGPDVDSGTAAEIGYATALGRWVLGYRSDPRPRGDNPGCLVNLQVEYFIRMRGELYTSLDGLIRALKEKVSAFNAAPAS